MARPKGSGGRSNYDKYRKFGRRSRFKKTRVRRSRSTGRFVKPGTKNTRRYKKSRFDK